MTKVGLVLGAGGVVGQAYHAGVLTALEADTGWDARDAEVVVGTSAGSIVAAVLRAGVPARDLIAWAEKAPLSVEGQVLGELFDEMPDLAPVDPRRIAARGVRAPHWSLLGRALRRPWQFRPVAAAMTVLAPGDISIVEHLEPLRSLTDDRWPDRDMWICAVRRRDGRRVVFGRHGSPPAPLHLAVAASCAVPGYFAPVTIGDHSYVDGGAHSPTNAALLLGRRDLDLVVVVSPMSAPGGLPTDLNGLLRQHSRHRLVQETGALRRAGLPVVVIQPDAVEQEAMGDDLLSRDRLLDVGRVAHDETLLKLRRPDLRELVRPLRRRQRPSSHEAFPA